MNHHSMRDRMSPAVRVLAGLVMAVGLLATVAAGHAAEVATPPETIGSLNVAPAAVDLSTARDLQSIVVQAVLSNGISQDVTDEASFQLADPAIVRIDGQTLHPVANGTTTLTVTYAGTSRQIPIDVRQVEVSPPISFRQDIMPIFLKSGCNTGSCHGAARGKDGFRLSLFGFDPQGDYHRITREWSGRRIDLALPEQCLLLEKATGKVAHTGGERFSSQSEYRATLLRWLQAGAPNDPGTVPAVTSIEIYPRGAVLNGPGATQRVMVRALYADGTDRDVTSLAYFRSGNDNAATISQQGIVTAGARGEAFIMARFDTHTVGTHFIVLPKDLDFEWEPIEEANEIDALIHAKLRKLRIRPSELCSDEEFLRRVTLDITGQLPTPDEVASFLATADPKGPLHDDTKGPPQPEDGGVPSNLGAGSNKREALVDRLLQRKESVELWAMKWPELLQIRTTQNVTTKSMLLYYNWLQGQIANDVPIDRMVRDLLASKGGTFANPATNYYQNETDTIKTTENVAQVFLGMRIQCTQCHNHPFDRWTMNDYYSFAAFFAQVGRKRGEDPREQIIFNRGSGEVRHPVDNRVMPPKFLGGDVPELKGRDRRKVLADWLASPENPFFARNLANMVWAHFFGRGIVDQVDDVRVSNPPVNPELLDMLAQRFVDYKFDFKKLVRDICTSRTYQLSTQTNPTNQGDRVNFSHATLRRLRAEVLLDIISQVTGTRNKFRGLPLGARAVQISDGNTSNYFLSTFGRAKRQSVCSCEVVTEPNLSQALHLLNGDTVNKKIVAGKVVEGLLKEGKKPAEVFDALYVRCLTRKPNAKELTALTAIVDADPEQPQQALEDTFWALLNSREFLFNH
ncbi:MAG: DUF1549 domain-containing protein [Pirellulales bacterium]